MKYAIGKGITSGRGAGRKMETSTRDGPNHITAPGKQTFRNPTPRRQQHTAPVEAAQTAPWSPGLTNQMEMD